MTRLIGSLRGSFASFSLSYFGENSCDYGKEKEDADDDSCDSASRESAMITRGGR